MLTTEEFEKDLRKLQETLELTEEDIQAILRMHRRYKNGEISIPRFEDE